MTAGDASRDETVGTRFVTHVFDETVALQRTLLAAETALADRHWDEQTRRLIRDALTDDRRLLADWERLGARYGASGIDGVTAAGVTEMVDQLTAPWLADGAASDLYDLHALVVTTKYRQQHNAAALRRFAPVLGDREVRSTAIDAERCQRLTGRALGRVLLALAKAIATTPPRNRTPVVDAS